MQVIYFQFSLINSPQMYGSNLQPNSRVVHLQSEEWNAYIQMSQMIPRPAVRIPDGGLSFSWVGCVMRGGGGVNQSSFRHISWCMQVRKMRGNERNHPLTPLPARSGTTIPHQIHLSIHPSSNHVCTRTRGSWVERYGKRGEKGRKKKSSFPFKPKGKAIAEGTENNKHSVM